MPKIRDHRKLVDSRTFRGFTKAGKKRYNDWLKLLTWKVFERLLKEAEG